VGVREVIRVGGRKGVCARPCKVGTVEGAGVGDGVSCVVVCVVLVVAKESRFTPVGGVIEVCVGVLDGGGGRCSFMHG
jgi:hypothetical protein